MMLAAQVEGLVIAPRASSTLVRVTRFTLGVSVSIVAILAMIFFFFAVPAWDDLTRATGPTQMSLWQYVIGHVYYHWQGRWASCGIEAIVLPHLDLTRYYGLCIGAVAIVDLAGIYALCRWLIPTASKASTLAVTACFAALLWAGLPSLSEAVYWFVGAVENAVVFALAVMLVIALIQLSKSPRRSIVGIVLLCTATIIICGFHELYGSMLLMVLGTGMIWSFFRREVSHPAWMAVTLSAVIGLVIVILAPGNAQRMASDGGTHGRHFHYDLLIALSQIRHFIPRWSLNPKLLAASVWIAFSPMLRTHRRRAQFAFPWHWILPPLWLAMLGLGFFAPSWAFGAWMPPRTLSGVYIVFVGGWLINLYVWTAPGRWMPVKIGWASNQISSLAGILFAISLLVMGNTTAAVTDLRHRIRPWHTAVENRFITLRNHSGSDAIVPMLPKPFPTLLLGSEIVNDPGDYHNWSMVSFFNLRSLRLIPATGPLPPVPAKPTRPPGGTEPT